MTKHIAIVLQLKRSCSRNLFSFGCCFLSLHPAHKASWACISCPSSNSPGWFRCCVCAYMLRGWFIGYLPTFGFCSCTPFCIKWFLEFRFLFPKIDVTTMSFFPLCQLYKFNNSSYFFIVTVCLSFSCTVTNLSVGINLI